MGCLERAGFAAGSVCGSTSGICSDGTSKSAMASYCRNICCIAHCISPASINSRCGVPGVATSAKLNLRPALASARLMASNVMEVTTGNVSSFAPNFFNSASMLDFLNRFVLHLGRIVDHDVIHAVAGEIKQVEQIIHALGVLAGKQKKCEPDALRGERFEQLQ